MTLSSQTLSAIQAAGQALDAARAALQSATQDHASQVMQAVADNPFGAENDHLFNRWKTIARLSQSVQDMETQCKAVFHTAAELAMDGDSDAKSSMRRVKPTLIGHASVDLAPSDVQAKTKTRAKPGRVAQKNPSSKPLKGNSAKVFAFLKERLDHKRFVRTTQSEIASGASLPTGSVAAALKQLGDKGVISEGDKGHYKLA